MRFGMEVLPMIGLLATLRPADSDDHDGSPTGGTHGDPTTGRTPAVAVIGDRAVHRVTLTVAALPTFPLATFPLATLRLERI